MTLWSRLRSWLAATLRRSRMESEMDAELRFHMEAYADDLIRSGVAHEEAMRLARIEFGGIERVKEEGREARGVSFLETLIQDLRHGARMLRKNPGFTSVAVLTLALGIGANTAIFSVINAVLFRPLPVEAPQELVDVYNASPGEMFEYSPLAYPDYIDFRDNNKTLSGLLGFAPNFLALERNGESEMISVEAVTENYFDVLGVKPVLGRTFNAGQDKTPGANPFVVLSYTTWQQKFGADPAIVWENRPPQRKRSHYPWRGSSQFLRLDEGPVPWPVDSRKHGCDLAYGGSSGRPREPMAFCHGTPETGNLGGTSPGGSENYRRSASSAVSENQ
jgi:hypothetical protein